MKHAVAAIVAASFAVPAVAQASYLHVREARIMTVRVAAKTGVRLDRDSIPCVRRSPYRVDCRYVARKVSWLSRVAKTDGSRGWLLTAHVTPQELVG